MSANGTQTSWAQLLPEAAARLLRGFVDAEARLVLVGPAARAVAKGDGLDGVRRLDFITDLEGGRLARLLESLSGLRVRGDGKRGFSVQHGEGGSTVQVKSGRKPRRGTGGGDAIAQDLALREITIHAIAIDEQGAVLDPYGGLADLAARRLRAIPPVRRLATENPRWMLRVAGHVAFYGFAADDELVAAARAQSSELLDVPRDAWREELERVLLRKHPDPALVFLQRAGLLAYLLPEVDALVDFHRSCPVHHKDIWEHTRLVVQRSEATPVQRWTALLHDVGKRATRTVGSDRDVHFLRHEELSAVLFQGIAARLRFPEELAEDVHYLIRNHSRVNLYSAEWTDSAVRRLVREVGERLEDLLAFSRADVTSRREGRVEMLRRLMDELEERVVQVREEEAYEAPLPKGIGSLIIQRFELEPGPAIGVLRKRLEDAVEEGVLERGLSAEDYVEKLAEWLEAERS